MSRGKHQHTRREPVIMRPPGSRTDLGTLLDIPPFDWPSDTGEIIHRFLADSKASEPDRLLAAQLAGNLVVINDALSDALLNIIGGADEPTPLRAAAAISLGPILDEADASDFGDEYDIVPITGQTFHRIQRTLQKLCLESTDESLPVLVRRRILEASVRSPQDWHRDAISRAYSSGDRDWILTAVFCMRWVRGFDDRILEALKSSDSDIHREAVLAAGSWSVEAAWPHVVSLVHNAEIPKSLLLAAIGAIAEIRPQEARDILTYLTSSPDREIAEAAEEAALFNFDDQGDEDDG